MEPRTKKSKGPARLATTAGPETKKEEKSATTRRLDNCGVFDRLLAWCIASAFSDQGVPRLRLSRLEHRPRQLPAVRGVGHLVEEDLNKEKR